MKPTLFLSDLHFHGDHTPGGRALLDVLDQARGEAEAVYLVGDVFDFWLGYRTTLYRACFPLLRRLAALVDAGTAVHLFTGNHDPEHGDFFGDIGVTVHDGPHTARIGGHTVWLEHGDLIDPRGLHHRLVCRVARHPWLHRAARLAPPAALWAVARAYARRGEHTYDEPLPAALLDAYLPARAREGADVVVMGHYHRAVVHTRQVDGRTVRFFGLGDWVKQRTWLRFDGDFTLLRYQDGGPPVALPEGDHAPPP